MEPKRISDYFLAKRRDPTRSKRKAKRSHSFSTQLAKRTNSPRAKPELVGDNHEESLTKPSTPLAQLSLWKFHTPPNNAATSSEENHSTASSSTQTRPVSAPKLVSTSTPSWSASKLVGNLEEAEILPTFKTPTARPTKSPVKMVSPKTPESASRGRMFAEMARLKAVTPPTSPVCSGSDSSRRLRMTARRRLLDPCHRSDSDREDEAGTRESSSIVMPTPTTISTPQRPLHKSCSAQDEDIGKASPVKESPSLQEFECIEFSSPTKTAAARRLPFTTTPTYDVSQELPLPASYQLLSEKFHCADTIVTMLEKRKETCTFSKLKSAVQQMTRRQFEERNLGQMKTVHPSAFTFCQESNVPGNYSGSSPRGSYQLTIETYRKEEELRRPPSNIPQTPKSRHLLSTDLIYRRRVFNRNLRSIVKKHHREFLSRLEPPLEIEDRDVVRWHPEFAVNAVPEVEAAELPAPPIKVMFLSAKDVLSPRVPTGTVTPQRDKKKEVVDGVVTTESPLKGVSLDLLEKIRAKEASKAKASITRSPVREKQRQMLSRFPDMVRIIRGYFIAEQKTAIAWDDVIQKLKESSTSLPADLLEEHLTYLSDVCNGWLSSVVIRKKRFVKLDKKMDVKLVLKQLNEKQKLLV